MSSHSSSIANIIANQRPFRAGGLQDFSHEWSKITSDPFILDTIAHYHIEFDAIPDPQISMIRSHLSFTDVEQNIVDSELTKFLEKGIIVYSCQEKGEIISPIFTRPKKDGSHRVIFNLKRLNEHVTYRHFKMDTLETAIRLMRPSCFMTSIDLKDAYYSIPIAPGHYKYLKFVWRDQLFAFTCLPMGLTSSPRVFTKVLKPVFSTLRSRFGLTCLGYIDDSIYFADNYLECEESTHHAVSLLSRLGFIIHPDKSVLTPSQCIEFLGFILDSTNMTVCLTTKKREKISQLCLEFRQPNKYFTIRQVAMLIGTLVSSFPGVEYGPLYYRDLESDKDLYLKNNNGNFDGLMTLSKDSLREVNWWSVHIHSAFRNIYHSNPDIVLYTDASGTGWGAKTDTGQETSGIWSKSESKMHINFLELLAIKLTLISLFGNHNCKHIRVMCDNTTAVSYVNAMGGCKSVDCNLVSREIWEWAIEHNTWISAAHIPGLDNIEADHLSRDLNLELEWMLSPQAFQKVVKELGSPDIDLFASRLNAQTEVYVSWKPDPKAKFTDAFSLNWSGYYFYAFPPFCLISRCVQKIIRESATGILIIPSWTTQAYFSVVLELLIDMPRILKASARNLVHPSIVGPHPMHNQLDLLVCKLSGDRSKSLAFREKLLRSSCVPGERTPTNSTRSTLKNGLSFVVKNQLIPYIRL